MNGSSEALQILRYYQNSTIRDTFTMAIPVLPLTATQVQKAKPKDKVYDLNDGKGLMLRITPSGAKTWFLNYRKPFTQKRTMISIGSFPETSLKQARKKRDEYRSLVAQDIDPKEYKDELEKAQQEAYTNTFRVVMDKWLDSKGNKVTPSYTAKIRRILELYILPSLGDKPVHLLKATDFISALRPVEDLGKLETLKRAIQYLNGVMNYAVNYGLIVSNPAQAIGEVFKKPVREHMATLKPEELPDLMSALNRANIKHQTRCLVEWQLHTMTRPNEAVGAKWSEIDFEQKLWAIPAERMKGRKEKKREHIVPLTKQTLALLDFMRPISGHRDFIFPNDKDPRKPMSSQTVNMALKRMGFQGRLVSHGLRALASTTLNEQGFNGDVIEACLAHIDKNEVRKAYNRTQYLEQRVKVMAWWSEHIEQASIGNLSLTGAKGLTVVK